MTVSAQRAKRLACMLTASDILKFEPSVANYKVLLDSTVTSEKQVIWTDFWLVLGREDII